MRLAKIGPELERFGKTCGGLVESFKVFKDEAQVRVGREEVGPLGNGLFQRRDGLVEPAQLRQQHAQIALNLGDVRPISENLAIDRDRFGGPPGASSRWACAAAASNLRSPVVIRVWSSAKLPGGETFTWIRPEPRRSKNGGRCGR